VHPRPPFDPNSSLVTWVHVGDPRGVGRGHEDLNGMRVVIDICGKEILGRGERDLEVSMENRTKSGYLKAEASLASSELICDSKKTHASSSNFNHPTPKTWPFQ